MRIGKAVHEAVWEIRPRTFAYCVLAVLVTVSFGLLAAHPANAVTFEVNSTGDDGDQAPNNGVCNTTPVQPGVEPECTLRAAIEQTNANNNDATTVDTIEFSIGGSGVATISPGSSLPPITEPVIIDGYSAPGATPNTKAVGNDAVLRIRLDGDDAAGFATGLDIRASDCVVRGLSITRFSLNAGIILRGADDTRIAGNFLGTSPGGTAKGLGNGLGLFLGSGFANPTNVPNDNTVGGTSPGARNLISGNGSGLEVISGERNEVTGNYIGTTKSGTSDLGNGGVGVIVAVRGANYTIGGSGGAARNVIAFNGDSGVRIGSSTSDADVTGHRILRNSIFSNDGLGIDLGGDGRTPNDGVGDLDTGPNNLQNFPTLSSARTGAQATTIRGTLRSIPAEGYTLQFFKNPKAARDEGKTFIGEKSVSDPDADGVISFTFRPENKVAMGMFVTATATRDKDATEFDTSEFSPPRRVAAP